MNSEPVWLPREVVLALQEELLNRFGGLGGIRDEGMLDSALHRAQQLFNYGKPTIFELAAAYAGGIVKNHPFLDGNKRAGLMAAYVFLAANRWDIEAAEQSVVERTLALAASAIDEAEYAAWLEQSCVAGLDPGK
ncbi:MAG: type II toxin-antitoxin system death-on-curing family toxin [Verrucomicrobiales bacterium]